MNVHFLDCTVCPHKISIGGYGEVEIIIIIIIKLKYKIIKCWSCTMRNFPSLWVQYFLKKSSGKVRHPQNVLR